MFSKIYKLNKDYVLPDAAHYAIYPIIHLMKDLRYESY